MERNVIRLNANGQKVAVFSDTHLTPRYNRAKATALRKIIQQADRVIINGDFWDGYVTSYDAFLSSRWRELFPLLLQKRALYVFGNHDAKRPVSYAPFSVGQADEVEVTQGGTVFHIEHGNRIAPTVEAQLRIPLWLLKPLVLFRDVLVFVVRRKYLYLYRGYNRIMKEWKRGHLPADEWLLCGHTHWAEVSPEERYANSGLVNWGIATYLALENGTVRLVRLS